MRGKVKQNCKTPFNSDMYTLSNCHGNSQLVQFTSMHSTQAQNRDISFVDSRIVGPESTSPLHAITPSYHLQHSKESDCHASNHGTNTVGRPKCNKGNTHAAREWVAGWRGGGGAGGGAISSIR